MPVCFLFIAEIVLRLSGTGYPTAFFLPLELDGQKVFVENARFGWRFFPRGAARVPRPTVIPAVKPPNTCRVFIFGESAAYGDPKPEFGLPRMVELLLSEHFPETRIEVVNVAMTAINSHVILPIAQECAQHDGDAWLIYMGNNEVVGPFGAGTVFGRQTPPLGVVRATIALKQSKLAQAVDLGLQRIRGGADGPQVFTGMDMFSENRVASGDSRMERVYSHFRRNLEGIISAGIHASVPIVLGTVGSNLKDCAPFASLHRPALTDSEKAEWQRLFEAGTAAQRLENHARAEEFFRRAMKLDDHHAELLFRLAQCELSLGRATNAQILFAKARDEDALRFRADSRLNEIVREAGKKHSAQGVRLLDLEKLLAAESSNQIAGAEFFYEHVHFNFTGNYVVARAAAEQVADAVPLLKRGGRGRWLTQTECAERLAFTDWNRLEGAELLRKRTSRPPFTYQFDHEIKMAADDREIQELRTRLDASALHDIQDVYRHAVNAAPRDWVLHENFGRLLHRMNDLTGAVQECEQVVKLLPHHAERWCQLGLYLHDAHREEEAARAFERALKLDSREARTYYGLGLTKLRGGQFALALKFLNQSLKLDPAFADGRVALGRALAGLGRTNEAVAEYERVLKTEPAHGKARVELNRLKFGPEKLQEQIVELLKLTAENPNDAALRSLLGQVLVADGRLEEAKKHFAAVVELDPQNAEAHYFLAQELARENQYDQAITHFARAAELQPGDSEAHFNLGVALARVRRFREALEQFEMTLRLNPTNAQARQYASTIRAQVPK